jgi:hypothetical protein
MTGARPDRTDRLADTVLSPCRDEASMDDEETLQRDALRRVMPLPDEDAADELADALARSRFRAEQLGCAEDVKLGPYILRRELGRGGMGVVFEAHDPVLMIPIALKLLQRGVGKDGSEADLRLQREAQALASVRGDHVVRVFSAGFYKNQAWIAMEFVAGPNLSEWLRYQREAGAVGWRDDPREVRRRRPRPAVDPPRRPHPPRLQAAQRRRGSGRQRPRPRLRPRDHRPPPRRPRADPRRPPALPRPHQHRRAGRHHPLRLPRTIRRHRPRPPQRPVQLLVGPPSLPPLPTAHKQANRAERLGFFAPGSWAIPHHDPLGYRGPGEEMETGSGGDRRAMARARGRQVRPPVRGGNSRAGPRRREARRGSVRAVL